MATMSEGSPASASSQSSCKAATNSNGFNGIADEEPTDLCLYNRPKRLIHYKKPDFSAEYAKHFGNSAAGDEDEDDEDFVVSSESDSGDGSEDDETSNDDANNGSKQELNKSEEPETKPEDSSEPQVQNSLSESQIQTTNGNKETPTRKRRKRRTNKKFKGKTDELDEDTRKIVDSFKKAQIVRKPRGRKPGTTTTTTPKKRGRKSKNDASLTETPATGNETTSRAILGPFVKEVKQKLAVETTEGKNSIVDYEAFVVRSAAVDKEAAPAGGLDIEVSKSYKILVPKDRPVAMRDPALIARCSLCDNLANCAPGLGELFGPYRVSDEYDMDLTEDQSSEPKLEEKEFNEVWLHEGCAIWSPNIYIKNNRVYGIAAAIKNAQDMKCVSCKKMFASISCRNVECNRVYHYLCAIKNECLFNEENFSIFCKPHSARKL